MIGDTKIVGKQLERSPEPMSGIFARPLLGAGRAFADPGCAEPARAGPALFFVL